MMQTLTVINMIILSHYSTILQQLQKYESSIYIITKKIEGSKVKILTFFVS